MSDPGNLTALATLAKQLLCEQQQQQHQQQHQQTQAPLDNNTYYEDYLLVDGDGSGEADAVLDPWTPTPPATTAGCPVVWDGRYCWSSDTHNQTVHLPCTQYPPYASHEGTVYRECLANGTWTPLANDTGCVLPETDTYADDIAAIFQLHGPNKYSTTIYLAGHALSAMVLIVVFTMFICIRSLRSLSTTIHCHLLFSLLLRSLSWLATHVWITLGDHTRHVDFDQDYMVCKAHVVVTCYCLTTTYFWMLNEGIYYYRFIVWRARDKTMNLCHYFVLGWLTPVILMVPWALLQWQYSEHWCWTDGGLFDIIYRSPIVIVEIINIVFFSRIVCVLSCGRPREKTSGAEFRQTVRGLFILFIILGISHIIYLTPLKNNDAILYMTIAIEAIQGLIIAVLLCCLNKKIGESCEQCCCRERVSSRVTTQNYTLNATPPRYV